MNFLADLVVHSAGRTSGVLIIVYIVLVTLLAILGFGWADSPNTVRGHRAIEVTLFVIIGILLYGL